MLCGNACVHACTQTHIQLHVQCNAYFFLIVTFTMITRPVRVYFPCSYLSHIKFRTHSCKSTVNQDEKIPFIWSPCSSYLCENQGENIVKKLDIDALMRSKVKEYLYLAVYSNVNKHGTFLQQRKQSNYIHIKDRDKLLQDFVHKGTSINEDVITLTSFREHLSLYNNISYNLPKKNIPSQDKDNLPSKEQLDEMMVYFMKQAPALFTSTGWSYNKCSYNIVFENEMIGSKTNSLNAYVMQINLMKNIARFILSNPELDIFRMTRCISDGTIDIRWQVQGIPRYLKPFSLFGLIDDRHFIRYIDGYSIFYINSDGLYHRHTLSKVTPLRSNVKNTVTSQFFTQIGLRQPGLDGDLPKQPAFPAFQDGRK